MSKRAITGLWVALLLASATQGEASRFDGWKVALAGTLVVAGVVLEWRKIACNLTP